MIEGERYDRCLAEYDFLDLIALLKEKSQPSSGTAAIRCFKNILYKQNNALLNGLWTKWYESFMECIQQLESYGCPFHGIHKVALIVECTDTKMFGSVLDDWMNSDHVETFEEIQNSVKIWYVNAKRNEDISDHMLRG